MTHLALFGDRVAFAASAPDDYREQTTDRVYTLDLTTRRITMVAGASEPGGQTDWVEGSGDNLVYTDEGAMQDDNDPDTTWVIWDVDLKTGMRRQIGSSGGQKQAFVPTPRVRDGIAVWQQDSKIGPTQHTDLMVADLASGKTKLVLAHIDGASQDVIDRNTVVVDRREDGTSAPGTPRFDAFSVDLATGTQTPVSTGGVTLWPRSSDAYVVWQSPVSGSPKAIVSRPNAGGPQRTIYAGESDGNVVATDSYAAWLQDGQAWTAPLDGSSAERELGAGADAATRIAADATDGRFAFAHADMLNTAAETTTVVVAHP